MKEGLKVVELLDGIKVLEAQLRSCIQTEITAFEEDAGVHVAEVGVGLTDITGFGTGGRSVVSAVRVELHEFK